MCVGVLGSREGTQPGEEGTEAAGETYPDMPAGIKPVGPWGASRARRQRDYPRCVAAPDLKVAETAGGRQCKHRELVRTPTCFGSQATQAIERLGLQLSCGCRLRGARQSGSAGMFETKTEIADRGKIKGGARVPAKRQGEKNFGMTARICGPAFLCFGRKSVGTYTREKEPLKGR